MGCAQEVDLENKAIPESDEELDDDDDSNNLFFVDLGAGKLQEDLSAASPAAAAVVEREEEEDPVLGAASPDEAQDDEEDEDNEAEEAVDEDEVEVDVDVEPMQEEEVQEEVGAIDDDMGGLAPAVAEEYESLSMDQADVGCFLEGEAHLETVAAAEDDEIDLLLREVSADFVVDAGDSVDMAPPSTKSEAVATSLVEVAGSSESTTASLLSRYVLGNPGCLEVPEIDSSVEADATACWVCGGDHDAELCPKKRCFLCAGTDHPSGGCPQRTQRCAFCRLRGHEAATCPTRLALEPTTLEALRCLRCGRLGHANCLFRARTASLDQPHDVPGAVIGNSASSPLASQEEPAPLVRTFSKALSPASPPPSPVASVARQEARTPTMASSVALSPLQAARPQARAIEAVPFASPPAQATARPDVETLLLGTNPSTLQRAKSGAITFSSASNLPSSSPSAKSQAKASYPANSAGTEPLGYLFVCSTATSVECHKLHVFGSPLKELEQMRRCILPTSLLFLLNFDGLKLMGPFVADGTPCRDLCPTAFGGRFNAQVRVQVQGPRLLEATLESRIKPGFKTAAETRDLLASLEAAGPAPVALQQKWRSMDSALPPAKRMRYDHQADGAAAKAMAKANIPKSGGNGPTLEPTPAVASASPPPSKAAAAANSKGGGKASFAELAAGGVGGGKAGKAQRGDRTGYVFLCRNSTFRDCQKLSLFGSPDKELEQMKRCIDEATDLFLFNLETYVVVGPFGAVDTPGRSLEANAFGGKFSAQVRVTPREDSIFEAVWDRRIAGGPKTVAETRALYETLRWGRSTPAGLSRAPTGLSRGLSFDEGDYNAGTQCGAEGRPYDLKSVVVNFANVGATYAEKVLRRDKEKGERMFDWEGVRRCVVSLTSESGYKVVGVVFENLRGPDTHNGVAVQDRLLPLPDDIKELCASIEETPRVTGRNHKSADDEMTIKCAYRRNCRFMDNDNYRDWLKEMRNEKIRKWLQESQELLQMRYFFDSQLGCFDTLDGNISTDMLTPSSPY